MSSKKTVICIVGGGNGGVVVARSLSQDLDPKKYDLVLINKLPYRIILPASLRMLVSDQGKLEERILVPYDKLFINGNGTFIEASVTQVNAGDKSGTLTLGDGRVIDYDVLVLATGSKWDGPTAFPDDAASINDHIAARRAELAKANEVLLIGGGSVGIELAGEIKDIWPDKSITIINRGSKLLNDTYSSKLRVGLQRQLQDRGVKLILDDSVEDLPVKSSGPVEITTVKGKSLKPDLIIPTWGGKPNTAYLPSNFLTPVGTVKVLPTLQVPSHPNIFALGDLIEWNEQKSAAKVQMGHAPIVTKNIQLYLQGSDVSKTGKKYKGSMEMIMVSNGRKSGMGWVGAMGGIHISPFFASRIKSKDLMIDMSRGISGN
ncbi:FAD/NAD(P)-binding domain-containing protein [Gymnopus androsaceus JB14]|uniref:FAD/NAD(P)-binding domain-containing protein n=1 Tax=Gymnopus androsaceus JB14 TaxID=1447944 RepID=A0A6A4HQW3_9AGAR|nr:FAD/NAD(P)-binding domain-containing protein [Gymnopus androsaceus JB14]